MDREHVRAVHPGEPVDERQRPLEPGPAGLEPVATMTSSADSIVTQSAVASTPSRTSTPSAVEPPPEPGEQVRDLAARRLQTGQPELPAERRPALQERDPVAALRRHPGGLQPGRPATDDQDPARVRRRLEPVAVPFPFAPGGRVDEARDPVVARAAAPAQLVARDARPDLVGAAGAGLGDQVRIGDLAADDADHVGVSGGQDGLGRGRRPDVALGLDQRVLHDAP